MSTTTNTNATITTNTIDNTKEVSVMSQVNQYGFTMPTHTKKSTSRPDCFTKSQWDTQTYNAYIQFIQVIQRVTTPEEYLVATTPLFNACGMPADMDHLLSLAIAITKDTTTEGEKVRKVSSIATFRQFFNGAWVERESRRVAFVAPKAPKPVTPKATKSNSKKGPTKAELAAQNAELLKQLDALKAALGIAA